MNEILFLYNWVPLTQKRGAYAECAGTNTVNDIKKALHALGHYVICVNLLNQEQLERLVNYHHIGRAFVIAEGYLDFPESLYDGSGAASIRRVLQSMGVVSTHSAAEVMELCRNKDLTYKVLQEAELPIPRHVCFNLADNNIAEQIATAQWQVNYPMFVKPTGGGNSIGIDEKSVINNAQELRTVLERLVNSYGITHALAESYLPGQEFTVGVMGHQEKYVLPILGFPANFPVRSNAVKKIEAEQRDKFQILYPTDSRYARLQHLALKTFEALGAKGVIRIDMKEDIDGNPYIIDVNGTPSLSAKGSLAFMSEHNGMTFRDLIGSVLKEQPLYQGVVEEDVLIV